MTGSGAPLPGVTCPVCGSKNDDYQVMAADKHAPRDGDVSICAYCSAVNVFTVAEVFGTTRVGLRRPTKPELTAYMRNPELRRALALVDQLRIRLAR